MSRPWDYDQAITHGFFGDRRPAPTTLTRPVGRLAVLGVVVLLAVAIVAGPLPNGIRILWAVAFLVAAVGALLAWLRSFGVLLERAHLGNLDRPGASDWRRWARFLVALVGYPALTLAGLLAFAALAPQIG